MFGFDAVEMQETIQLAKQEARKRALDKAQRRAKRRQESGRTLHLASGDIVVDPQGRFYSAR